MIIYQRRNHFLLIVRAALILRYYGVSHFSPRTPKVWERWSRDTITIYIVFFLYIDLGKKKIKLNCFIYDPMQFRIRPPEASDPLLKTCCSLKLTLMLYYNMSLKIFNVQQRHQQFM